MFLTDKILYIYNQFYHPLPIKLPPNSVWQYWLGGRSSWYMFWNYNHPLSFSLRYCKRLSATTRFYVNIDLWFRVVIIKNKYVLQMAV